MGNVFFFEIFPRARPWRRLTARWKPFPNDLVPLFFVCLFSLPFFPKGKMWITPKDKLYSLYNIVGWGFFRQTFKKSR